MHFNTITISIIINNHLRITMLKLQTERFMYHFIFLQVINQRSLMNNQPPSIISDITNITEDIQEHQPCNRNENQYIINETHGLCSFFILFLC